MTFQEQRVRLMDASTPLVYILKGQRLVGYDNHERKDDHRHFRATTSPYVFTTVDRLIEDFRCDMATVKKELGK